MKALKAGLISAGVALAALTAADAMAQDGHVTWHDDGSVDLIMEDGAVIKTSRDELGSLFGPGEKPFEGTTITVLTLDSGPRGGISGPIFSFRPIWEELSGGKLEIALTPITDLYAKMMLDLRQGTGLYDGIIVGAFFYGDLVAGDYMLPIEEYMQSGEHPQWTYDSMPASLKTLHTWGDTGYGVAPVQGLVGGEYVVAQPLEAGGRAFAHIHHALGVSGEVGVGHHGEDAFERLGLRGIYILYVGVGVRAADDVAVEQSRGVVVRAVQRASGNLVGPIVADGTSADHVVGFCGQHHVSFVVNGSGHGLSLLHLHRRILDRSDDLVVTGAAAEVVGEPESNLVLGGVGVLLQERLGGDDEARGADAALERGVLQECLLHGMESASLGDALNGSYLLALGLDTKDQAGGYDATVELDRAGSAVAVVAAFLGAGKPDLVAQDLEQALARLA